MSPSALLRAMRVSARSLCRAPVFTVSALLLVSVGVGSTTATYSALDAAILRPLPFPRAEQLVTVRNVDLPYEFGQRIFHPRAYLADVERLGVFSSAAADAVGALNLGGASEPVRATVAYVTTGFFHTLGRSPIIGRTFSSAEGTRGGNAHVAVISYHLWVQQFGRLSTVLGRTFTLNDHAYRVVGVMPSDFAFPSQPDLWLPIPLPISNPEIFEAFGLYIPTTIIARLRVGESVAAANAAVARLERNYPTWSFMDDSSARTLVRPLQASFVAPATRRSLVLATGAGLLVLMLSCTNLFVLLSARDADRRHEVAIRIALGAPRPRLVGQLTIEALVLGILGSIGGLGIAWASMAMLSVLLPPKLIAITQPRLDLRAVALAVTVSLAATLAVGVALALRTSREAVAGRDFRSRIGRRGNSTVRDVLSGCEVAGALVLVVSAGLLVTSVHRLTSVDTGMRIDDVETAQVSLPRNAYSSPASIAGFVRAVLGALAVEPGVQSAGAIDALPVAGHGGAGAVLTTPEAPADSLLPLTYSVTPGYFGSMGIAISGGRDFRWTDGADDAVVLNVQAARQLWRTADAVGRTVVVSGIPRRVIGVIADVRTKSLDHSAAAQVYLPFSDQPTSTATFVARGTMPHDALALRLRQAIHGVDERQPVYDLRAMDEVIAGSIARERAIAFLLSILSAMALVLAATGAYAVTAYSTGMRRREFSVRLAIGAEPAGLLLLVIRRAAVVAACGLGAGVVAAAIVAQYIRTLLYNVGPFSPSAFSIAGAVLMAAVMLGSLIPAIRAVRSDPMLVLRADR